MKISTVLFTYTFINLLIIHFVSADVQWNGNWAFSCDFNGNDLANVQIRGDDCGRKCASTPGCTHFTWTTYNGGICWMKQGPISKSNAVSTNDQSMVCGVMKDDPISGVNWNGKNWALGCDFNGNDLSNVQIRGDDCGGRCAQTPGCTHFTWTTYNGGTCWMKNGGASQGNAVATGDNSMVCGFMTSGPGNEGTTTRYWDCCKPSCSWSANVLGDKRVNTCYKDGNTVTNNPNAASGCGGGEAFACNNQKPWAVNDQLAYGFAAATIPGLSKQERCCSCYKLVFASGPVEGKTMIVQVTNSGDDVGAHQFDLQIPGGGVGLFNGCTNQWGAPPNAWGQQYGGVGSRGECYSLPEQIRDGCLFRFDWFRGADNPRMRYSKVACPSELVGITGCSHD